ncbi:MAG TPA: hypothetical protein VGG99_28910 [Acetobacteraceae bacterium]
MHAEHADGAGRMRLCGLPGSVVIAGLAVQPDAGFWLIRVFCVHRLLICV